ncbi:hypothetical protein ACW5XW_24175 [Aeromonas piscicola]|uniref:hypothetical protein n=1 Tax=Aeromonas piscicola TaxID=600645 RepID=UPI0005B52406|nr:hypothetical protein [Aeromonas piscicola]
MAGVNVVMSAQTQKYVNDIKKAQQEGNKSFNTISKDATNMGNEVTSAFNLPSNAVTGFLARLGPVAGALGIIGGAAYGAGVKLAQMGAEVGKNQKQLELLAKQSGLTAQQVNEIGLAATGVGIDLEKLGDISRDVIDRIGDNISTGGGALQDLWDTLKGKSAMTIEDLKGLGGIEALKRIQQELDLVGASTAQQTFVMESLSSDASKLSGVLRMNEQQLSDMLDGYATKRASLAQSTITDIDRIQSNMNTLSNNFNAAMVNSFSSLIRLADTMTKKISDSLYDMSESAKSQQVVGDYISGGKVSSGNSQDLIDNASKIQEQIRMDSAAKASIEFNPIFNADEFKKRRDELISQGMEKLRQDVVKATDFKNSEQINAQSSGTTGNAAAVSYGSSKDANKALEENEKQRIQIMSEMGKIETQLQNSIGDETTKALQSSLTQQQDLLKANGEQRNTITEAQSKFALEAAQKRFTALGVLNKTEEDAANYAHQQQLENLKKYLAEGSLTQSEFDEAKLIAAKTLSEKLVEIKDNQLKREKELETKAFNEQQAILQGKLGFAVLAQDKADLELEIAVTAAQRQMEVVNEQAGSEVITEQMKQDKISELRQEHRDKEIERELVDIQSAEQRDIIKWEMKRQFLDEQYELGLLSEEAYAEKSLEIDRNTTAAKRALIQVQLGNMSELFSGMAQNLEKGSKMQRAAFSLEKASTVANVTLAGFDALAAIDKDPSLPTLASKNIAKATTIASTGAQIAGAVAVTMGQFHSGTDSAPYAGEISNTGSYILKGGERVVQAEANKDLTAYLESNKSNSGAVSVSMPVTIQGDVSEDSLPKLQAQLIESAELISHLVRQDQSNRGG